MVKKKNQEKSCEGIKLCTIFVILQQVKHFEEKIQK